MQHADTCIKSLENHVPITAPSVIGVTVGARGEDDLIGGLGGLGGLVGGLIGGSGL